MILGHVRSVRSNEPATFAWANLRRSQNVELLTERLIDIHAVPTKLHDRVKKQATQLRNCLIQAREYFVAAAAVSVATKPTLLYYGLMSLALAEILFKQSGDSSLDRAREQNRHHGLTMTVGAFPKNPTLSDAARQLLARPMEGKRRGTFELWHRSSREHPLAGYVTNTIATGGSTLGLDAVLGAFDEPLPQFPDEGMTLEDALNGLPLLVEDMSSLGLQTQFVRGVVSNHVRHQLPFGWSSTLTVIFHPSELNAAIVEKLKVPAGCVDQIDFTATDDNSCIIRISGDWVSGGVSMPMPPATNINTKEWRMLTVPQSLNEFGYFYVALYLAGNYARYYPDRWVLDVERANPLAVAIEQLCKLAEWRVPWLTASELDGVLYVRDE